MPLNVKNDATHALAKKLAALTGKSISEAVHKAIEDTLEREMRAGSFQERCKKLRAISKRAGALKVRDARTAEEIIGYDENGLPL